MWIASLADGRTIRQEDRKGEPGELSEWQQLRKEAPKLTQLRLQIGGVTIVGLPKADGYVFLKMAEVTMSKGQSSSKVIRQGIGSVVGDVVVMNWLDNSQTVWAEIIPLDDGMKLSAIMN